jgi:hypothetical protein
MSNQTAGQINPDFELSPEAALQINVDLARFMFSGLKDETEFVTGEDFAILKPSGTKIRIGKWSGTFLTGTVYENELKFTTDLNWLAHVSRKVFDFILTIQNDDDRAHEILSDVDDLWHSAAIWMAKNKPSIAAVKIHECITAINKYNEQTGS